jgi:hypothetical protein
MSLRPGFAWPFSHVIPLPCRLAMIAALLSGPFAAHGALSGWQHEEKAT